MKTPTDRVSRAAVHLQARSDFCSSENVDRKCFHRRKATAIAAIPYTPSSVARPKGTLSVVKANRIKELTAKLRPRARIGA